MNCIFCKIVEGTLPSSKVYEDEHIVAFRDIVPQAAVHILVIPKKHIASLNDAEAADLELLGRLQLVAAQVAREQGLTEGGYRVATNHGRDAGQVVFHLHYHLLGGEKLSQVNAKE